MPRKIDISQMTPDEIVAYAEKVKQQNRDRVKKHYNNTIKTDPERYELWLQQCREANNRQYYKRMNRTQSVMDQNIENALVIYL